MTKAEWQECADPDRMLAYLEGNASERKLRLLICACCRRVRVCWAVDLLLGKE
jgi:hypothetical protein